MQTFVLPSSHAPSARNADSKLTPEKPSHAGEKFGDVMERALTGTPRESDDADSEAQVKSGTGETSKSDRTDHTSKSKKPLRHDRPLDDTNAAHANAANTGAHAIQPVGQSDSDDEGDSHDAAETGADKGKPTAAAGNTDATSVIIAAQFLALNGAPLPISLPPAPTANLAAARGSKEGKGTAAPVLNTPTKGEATSLTGKVAEALAEHVEPADQADPVAQVDADSDSKGAEKNAPTEHAPASTAPTANNGSPVPLALALQSTESHADKVDINSLSALTASAPDAQTAQNATAAQPKASVENASASPDLHGTYAAKQDTTMKKADKTPKVTGLAEQDLPGATVTGSEDLPTGQKLSAKASLHGDDKLEAAASVDPSAAAKISTSVEPAAPNITTAAVEPTHSVDTRVLERTHDIVALHAMRLAQTGSDSLHVVVKPGAGIQLSLELRQGQEGIEVRASLHKGDFEHLNQYWPELQQRLESRGVRVGALTTSENFSSTSQQQFQQSKQQTSQQDPLYAGAFAEFALAGSVSDAAATRAARATTYRGWETWA